MLALGAKGFSFNQNITTSLGEHNYQGEHIIVYIPPLEKGGKGGFETWKIPLNPPLLKGDFPNLDLI